MKVTIIITPVSSLPSLNISPNTQVVKVTVYDGRFNQSPGGGIPEAPNDSNAYLRSGLTWVIGYTKTFLDNTFAAISQAIDNLSNNLSNHVSDTNNPHSVTASQVGAYSTSQVDTALGNKVDKAIGLQLSEESFTSTEKTKLSGIEAGAQVNVKPDWNALPGAVNEILNKPNIQPSPYKLFSCYKGTQGITGITVNSVFTLGVVTIPANTISAGDWMELTAVFTKYNTGIAQFGIAIGSSIALPSVTTQFAGSQATDNNNRILAVERKQIKITANGLIAPNILTTMNDSNLSNPILTITGINWGVVNYIIPYVFNISATTVLANLEAFEVRIK